MKTIFIILILCLSFRLMAQNICHTNYDMTFTWGTNSFTGETMALFDNEKQVTTCYYPSTNLFFNITNAPNLGTLSLQGQLGTNTTHIVQWGIFDTNQFTIQLSDPTINNLIGL